MVKIVGNCLDLFDLEKLEAADHNPIHVETEKFVKTFALDPDNFDYGHFVIGFGRDTEVGPDAFNTYVLHMWSKNPVKWEEEIEAIDECISKIILRATQRLLEYRHSTVLRWPEICDEAGMIDRLQRMKDVCVADMGQGGNAVGVAGLSQWTRPDEPALEGLSEVEECLKRQKHARKWE